MAWQFYLHIFDKLFWCWGWHNYMASGGADEPFFHSFVNERQKGIVVSINIQQSHLPNWTKTFSFIHILNLRDSNFYNVQFYKIIILQYGEGLYRFIMDAKLSPCYHLKELLKCPITTFIHINTSTQKKNTQKYMFFKNYRTTGKKKFISLKIEKKTKKFGISKKEIEKITIF